MLGFTPVRDRDAAAVDPDLRVVNRFLKEYKNAWDRFVDSWLVIKVANPEYSHKWRLQAEKRMRAAGKPAMTDEEVEAFVDRFMPAYRCYLPGLYEKGPTTANIQDANVLVVEVDETRSPVANQRIQCSSETNDREANHTEKDVPQPQLLLAFGFINLNPPPMSSSE